MGPTSHGRAPLVKSQTTAYNQPGFHHTSSSGLVNKEQSKEHPSQNHHVRSSTSKQGHSATAKYTTAITEQGTLNSKAANAATDASGYLPVNTDIGNYDGGFERDEGELSNQVINREAAETLALDSSTSRLAPTKPWKLNSFELGRPLGKGKFGRVYMVRTLCEPRYIIALKCLHKIEIVEAKVEKQVRREIEIQSHLRWAKDSHRKVK